MLFFAGPLLWLLSLAIQNAAEVYFSEIRILPCEPTTSNFIDVIRNPLFPVYLWNG
jgi:multiple sugar transport system permease protein